MEYLIAIIEILLWVTLLSMYLDILKIKDYLKMLGGVNGL